MNHLKLSVAFLTTVLVVALGPKVLASAANAPDRPDPTEIPLPEIRTSLGKLPGPGELPSNWQMPDPLVMIDGTKVTTPEQWAKRRAEMLRIVEYYGVGQAPPPPGNVKGTELMSVLASDHISRYRLVHLTFGPEQKLSLDIGIIAPATGGPFPVIISQGGSAPGATILPHLPNGPTQGRGLDVLLPEAMPTGPPVPITNAPGLGATQPNSGGNAADRLAGQFALQLAHGFAVVLYNNGDAAEDTTLRLPDGTFAFRSTRFLPAYPGYDWGILRAWAWGASRVVDYLVTDPTIDRRVLGITGVSRTGKSAVIAGAFDERITLTLPVVTGGGGLGAFRFSLSDTAANENLDVMVRKYPNWFSPHLHEFWGQVDKLPFDAHWYLALIAPRGVIALEGLTDTVSYAPAVKQAWLAAQPVFKLLGVTDHLGVIYGNHGHAAPTRDDWVDVMNFTDHTLLSKNVERKALDQFPPVADGPGPIVTPPSPKN